MIVKVVCVGAREIVKSLEIFTALEEDLALFPASTQLQVTPVPGDSKLSSDLCWYCTLMVHIHILVV